MIILGIDPGSRRTGYGIINSTPKYQFYVTSGYLQISGNDWGFRLKQIYTDLLEIINLYQPEQVSIEQVFVHKNANSALKLGQARGAAMVAVANMNLPIYEYSAKKIKQIVTGIGNASKLQVQTTVQNLLQLDKIPQQDAADALAIALCHGFNANSKIFQFNLN